MRNRLLAFVLACSVAWASGCSSSKSTTAPSPDIDLNGTWRGQFAVPGATAPMTWTLMQTGTAVSGPVLVTLPNGIVLLNGFLTGTLSGTTLPYTISVGPGGIPSQPSCAGQLTGTMAVTVGVTSTLAGNYAVGSSTCTPPFAATGNISLTR